MNAEARIRQLEYELSQLKAVQRTCQHSFKAPVYNPETVREERVSSMPRSQGVHLFYDTCYVDVKKDRWSRTCSKCGFVEHTYKRVEKVVEYQPIFGR